MTNYQSKERNLPESMVGRDFVAGLQSYRTRVGLSQRELAKLLDYDPGRLNKILTGKLGIPSTRRSRRFYEAISNLPRMLQEEVNLMLNSTSIPHWARTNPQPTLTNDRFSITEGDLQVHVDFQAPKNVISPEDAEDFCLMLRGAAGLLLKDIIRGKSLADK